jgi:hypothetical protein
MATNVQNRGSAPAAAPTVPPAGVSAEEKKAVVAETQLKDTQEKIALLQKDPRKPPCPGCGSRNSTVNGTKGNVRQRVCSGCGRSFATIELVKKEE